MSTGALVQAPLERNIFAAPPPVRSRAVWLPGLCVAVFFAVWGLRGLSTHNVIDTDAARHAMNGAFLRDFLASGDWRHPVKFAEAYYSHFPALSIPYHPPVFPLLEALVFGMFGVDIITVRVLIAFCTFGSLWLLLQIGNRTTGSWWLAICAAATFASWRSALIVASDAMLEFPALLFTLAAILLLIDLDRFGWQKGLLFGVLAGLAVWTKQHAVFLVALPIVYIVLARGARFLGMGGAWVAVVAAAIPVAALHQFSSLYRGVGTDQVVQSSVIGNTIVHHLLYYAEATAELLGWTVTAVLGAVLLFSLVKCLQRRAGDGTVLLLSWFLCAAAVLLLIGPYDPRYLFFAYPALALLAFGALREAAAGVMGARWSWTVPAALALLCTVYGLATTPVNYLTGPDQAAQAVLSAGGPAQRVLYCGSTDGNFIFSLRSGGGRESAVITGEKLTDAVREPAALADFAERYGVSRVVIETSARPQACDAVAFNPPPAFVMERRIPLDSSVPRWKNGSLTVYRVNTSGQARANRLLLPIPKVGGFVQADLGTKP